MISKSFAWVSECRAKNVLVFTASPYGMVLPFCFDDGTRLITCIVPNGYHGDEINFALIKKRISHRQFADFLRLSSESFLAWCAVMKMSSAIETWICNKWKSPNSQSSFIGEEKCIYILSWGENIIKDIDDKPQLCRMLQISLNHFLNENHVPNNG